MKVRVMVYHPSQPHSPIAMSHDVYDLADLDDEIGRHDILAKWKADGSRATGHAARANEDGLQARVVRDPDSREPRG